MLGGLTSLKGHSVLERAEKKPTKTQTKTWELIKYKEVHSTKENGGKILTEAKWSMAAQVLLNLNHQSAAQKLVP